MSRINPSGDKSLAEYHTLSLEQLLESYKETKIYKAVVLDNNFNIEIKSVQQFALSRGKRPIREGLELPEIIERSLTFFLAYTGSHDNIVELLIAHFPNQLSEAMQGYAEAGNEIKVNALLKQYSHSFLIYSAMVGCARSYRIPQLARLAALSVSQQYATTFECEIFLKPKLPAHLSKYRSKYLLINHDPSHFYYIDSKNEKVAIKLSKPLQFQRELKQLEYDYFTNTGKTNPICLSRQQMEELIISGKSYTPVSNFIGVIYALHPALNLDDKLQDQAVFKLLMYLDDHNARTPVIAELKRRFAKTDRVKLASIISEATVMRETFRKLCCAKALPPEIIFSIASFIAPLEQKEREPFLKHSTLSLPPRTHGLKNLFSWVSSLRHVHSVTHLQPASLSKKL